MDRPGQRIKAYILIAVFGISGAVSSGSSVLCVGDDGHFKIERAVESCCDPNVDPVSDRASKNDNHEDADCGNCNDMEVSSLLSNNRQVERTDCEAPTRYDLINFPDSKAMRLVSTFDKRDILITSFPTASQLGLTTAVLIL